VLITNNKKNQLSGMVPPAFDPTRRDVMKALGVGAVASGIGGTATAQEDGENGESDDADSDEAAGTVHEVRTLVQGPPTNPERPADFFYQPTGLAVEPGDVVKFVFVMPDHNVVSYHPAFGMQRRVPTGVQAFSSPLLGWRPESIPGDQTEPPAEGADAEEGDDGPVPDTWLHAFETPGVYDLLCSPHEGFGMAMRVVVGGETDAPFETEDPSALPEPRAGPVGLARVTLTDPALQPETIVDEGRVEWGDLDAVGSGGAMTATPEQ